MLIATGNTRATYNRGTDMHTVGCNFEKPPIEVEHATLTCCGRPNQWKSDCPVCQKGVLLVGRDAETYVLEAEDICRFCGQRFIYTDIEDMRRKDGMK